jgi:hypothetical protein
MTWRNSVYFYSCSNHLISRFIPYQFHTISLKALQEEEAAKWQVLNIVFVSIH